MKPLSTHKIKLENFDDLFVGDPKSVEKNLKIFSKRAKKIKNNSLFVQILTQIALAQALQKKFNAAHKTLNIAEKELNPTDFLARVRILIERGRVYYQSFQFKDALSYFKRAYTLSKKHKFDYHTSDAAHLIPAVIKNVNEKIKWYKIVISIAKKTKDKRTRQTLVVDYQGLALIYLEAKQYKKALKLFQLSKQLEKKMNFPSLGSEWGIAKSLRKLGKLDEALKIQLGVLDFYNKTYKNKVFPAHLLYARGQVYEELAEIYHEKSKHFALLGYHDLSQEKWFIKLESQRINNLKKMTAKSK